MAKCKISDEPQTVGRYTPVLPTVALFNVTQHYVKWSRGHLCLSVQEFSGMFSLCSESIRELGCSGRLECDFLYRYSIADYGIFKSLWKVRFKK